MPRLAIEPCRACSPGLRTGPIAWLAELDYVVDDGFDEGRRA